MREEVSRTRARGDLLTRYAWPAPEPTAYLRRLGCRAAFEAKTVVARSPTIAMPIARRRGHGVPFGPDTELVVEGFPRSANSYTVAAIELAQERPMRIAHHLHAPAHVIAACRSRRPVLVLVRDPDEAVMCLTISNQWLSLRQGFRAYARFYRPLVRWRDSFVIGAFPQVTTDLGGVIDELNARFSLDLRRNDDTNEERQACFDAMDGFWRSRVGGGEALERVVGRPSPWRDGRCAQMAPLLDDPSLAHVRRQAHELFHELAVGRVSV